MNIETLKVFKDLIETENFSKTAQLNYVSQSAVSQQIKKLELIFKTKFFIKKEAGFEITESGKIFYDSSKRIMAIYGDAISRIKKDVLEKPNEALRIDSIYSVGIYLIGDYIKDFLNANPFVKINLEYKRYAEIAENVFKGRSDFGFIACGLENKKDLAAMPLIEEELVVIAPSSLNLKPEVKEIAVKDISKFNMVLFDRCSPSRKYIEKFLKTKSVKINVAMEIDNVETIKATVMSGAGISIVPLSCLRDEEVGGKLKVLHLKDVKFTRPIYLVYNKRKKMSSSASSFLNMMLSKKAELIKAGR